jgi:peptide/nickel transport system ATP-binding protein
MTSAGHADTTPRAATSASAATRPAPARDDGPPLLEVRHLARRYRLPRQRLLAPPPEVQALDGVSFTLRAGRSLGVVGESGSGKSTLARLVMALERPSTGQVLFDGRDLHALPPAALREARSALQMVFQDPYGSLDPRQPVARIVGEPLERLAHVPAAERRDRVRAMLHAVGLGDADANRYPHEFSGGQRQRVAIARAMVTRPRLIVADEPVSALDVSVQAQVLNLMQDLQDQFGVTYLFISHDLAVVDLVCDEVIVLYRGRVVEQAPADTLFRSAAHPYTRALIDAVPPVDPRQQSAPPALAPPPPRDPSPPVVGRGSGCTFAPRCALRHGRCLSENPELRPIGADHRAACHVAESVLAAATPAP